MGNLALSRLRREDSHCRRRCTYRPAGIAFLVGEPENGHRLRSNPFGRATDGATLAGHDAPAILADRRGSITCLAPSVAAVHRRELLWANRSLRGYDRCGAVTQT